jgi:two-component system chemotaxis response regulator CheB
MLERDSDIKVIATATDPIFAREKMAAEWPDVLILDVEMPRMDGLSFLRQLMSEHPTPTIICSHMAEKGSAVMRDALAIGALSVISKPQVGVRQFIEETAQDFCRAVHAAAKAAPTLKALPRGKGNVSVRAVLAPAIPADRPKYTADVILPLSRNNPLTPASERIIAIGTSTGGTQALESVLTRLPANILGIVIVQHMPENFTGMFTQRLSQQCKIKVREAQDGDQVRPGLALIAPGGKHMLVRRVGARFQVEVRDGPHVSRHIPSVDVLFRSVACCAGAGALGIIMTGMGDDGATGLKEMHDAGARTIAQDEASCVVFGMPKEAIRLGAADEIMPLAKIPDASLAYSVQRTEDT